MGKINLDANGDGKITKEDASYFGKGLKEVSKILKKSKSSKAKKVSEPKPVKKVEEEKQKEGNYNYYCPNCDSRICFTGGRSTAIECTVCHKKI